MQDEEYTRENRIVDMILRMVTSHMETMEPGPAGHHGGGHEDLRKTKAELSNALREALQPTEPVHNSRSYARLLEDLSRSLGEVVSEVVSTLEPGSDGELTGDWRARDAATKEFLAHLVELIRAQVAGNPQAEAIK
jgi:hypothetical protein